MTMPHLHLLLNHLPTVGTIIAIGLLLLSIIRKSVDLRRVSLEIFCVIALMTLPAYLSGVFAQPAIQDRPEVSLALIQAHHDAAILAFIFMLLTGLFAWLGLWQIRRLGGPGRGTVGVVLLMSVVTLALMGRTATLGGDIRHPELTLAELQEVQEGVAGPATAWINAERIAQLATGTTWLWPAAEALHFIGLWLLFGVVVVVHARLLGMMKSVSFAALHRLLPWGVLGLGLNTLTGMLFVIGAPTQYMNGTFYMKIVLLLLAGFSLLYVTIFDEPWEVDAGRDAPLVAKAVAGSTIVLWVGVMYFGRMLPFLGDAF